ncbi:hypothetical protein F5Y14DRAFT_254760 [Nemania sp. NC0429]|nr:hypothetical protein F5Y14DRAFT_254760 [Nemania sp. NC0429]
MRRQGIANATPNHPNAKRKAVASSPSSPLSDAAPDSDVPRPLPNPSKRPVSTIEAEDGTEYQHPRKRARTEGKATTIEGRQVLDSDCIPDARRSVSPWPGIDEAPSQPVDPSEALRHRRLCEEVDGAISRWEKQRDRQCEAYRLFRLQRLPSPAPSDDDDDDDFPHDSDADEFGYTPLMLGLDNDDPRVEEVFGLAYTRKLEMRGLRKPSRRPAVHASPDGPLRIRRPLSTVDGPRDDWTFDIDHTSTFRARRPPSKASRKIIGPSRNSSPRITRQSVQRKAVFYELDRRTRARVVKP